MYKGFSRLRVGTTEIVDDTIQFDLYVPHSLVNREFRIYKIESKIVSLLHNKPVEVGIGNLYYSSGQFIQLPPISGYSQYKMIFTIVQGVSSIGRR